MFNARLSPEESMKINNICPVCGKKVTIGVMHRLEALADREDGFVDKKSPSFKSVVPLCGDNRRCVRCERGFYEVEKNIFS